MTVEPHRFDDGKGGRVSAVIAYPDRFAAGRAPVVILAHGAGNDMTNPLLSAVHEGLATHGYPCVKFNFPYTEQGRRAPDSQQVLETCYRSIVAAVRADARLRPPRLVIGGKSLGGRIASQIVAQGMQVDGLLFLGYPLHPPGKPEKLRIAHLTRITVPMLFFAGTRDPLCTLDLLRQTVQQLTAPTTLHVIEDGDHSFTVRKRTGRTQGEVYEEVVTASVAWLRSNLAG
ncbi:MAG: alpha/beta family hydrolase [Thermodesulfobacteriota bacterium]|jgi:predicted alpha/beta-hydrolase family hydrolase